MTEVEANLVGPLSDHDREPDDKIVRLELERLRQEHADLDAAVLALQTQSSPNQLQIVRIKKRKLVLRDQIAQLENRLTPDLIA